jgi:FkbM family methyltransferase
MAPTLGNLVFNGIKKILNLFIMLKIFCNVNDIMIYAMLNKSRAGDKYIGLKMRATGGRRQFCRLNTTDVEELWCAFYNQYHLPPCHLPEQCTILDLGANAGYTMSHMAGLYPKATIVGVEMDIGNYELAVKNTEWCGSRCRIINAAVWPEEGFISYGGNDENAYAVRGENDNKSNLIKSQTITIASLIKQCKIEFIDYVKIDIEGAESEIFKTNVDWLKQVGAIKIEVHPPATIEGIRAVLTENGFAAFKDQKHWSCVAGIKNKQLPS